MKKYVNRQVCMKGFSALFAGMACLSVQAEDKPASKPNIVFILGDDHRFDALSCLGHPFVKTPHIDRIAKDGAVFSNFFVTTALCSPSRASFLTGAYAHNHKAMINDWCDPQLTTYPQVLQKSGYNTGYIGKWHLARHNRPRDGFDTWFSFTGQGHYTRNTFNHNGTLVKSKKYVTDEITDRSVAYIKANKDKPFALYVSHKAIHGPFTPADRHKDLYKDVEIPQPKTWTEDFDDKPEELRKLYTQDAQFKKWGGERQLKLRYEDGKKLPLWDPPTSAIKDKVGVGKWDGKRPKTIDYFRAIAAIDDGVGKIYQTLDDLKLTDNTIVIYAGDNGFGCGEHRRFAGKRLAYDESIRVPFVISWPARFSKEQVIDELCLNIDMAPTLLDAAGAEIPKSMDGRSMMPLLEGKKTEWRTSFLYEYFKEPWTQKYPSILGVRTKEWKYVTYPDSKEEYKIKDELYDLKKDPLESRNLTLEQSYADTKRRLADELERLKKETGYQPFKPRDVYDPKL